MAGWGAWAKQQLANVAGTAEPVYGPDAIQSVAKQAGETPYTELTRDDLKWAVMDSTNVETQTFYFLSDEGKLGMAQVIYSNVVGMRITCQFNAKIFNTDGETPHLWSSTPLENYGFDESQHSFYADNVALDLSQDGNTYTIKSLADPNCVVDIKLTRAAPGFVVGKNGTSTFGTDPAAPWGRMRHAFWPRCKVEGKMITPGGEVNFNGRGMFSHALQGMKPHHAAAKWNFVNFQSPTYSAIMMEYTTPPSYGTTSVNVGGVVTDDKVIFAGASTSARHTEIKGDPENDWPEPSAVSFQWKGKTSDGQAAEAELAGSLGARLDRVDVMAEVPKFVKQIVAGAAGTKPYIYQYASTLKLKLKIGDEEKEEEGSLFMEATFIS